MWQSSFLKNFLEFLLEEALHTMGRPFAVKTVLTKHPTLITDFPLPPKSADALSGINWQDWADGDQHLQGRTQVAGLYTGTRLKLDELSQLIRRETIESFTCDIQDVVALSASKSNLDEFASLDDLVVTNSPEMITDSEGGFDFSVSKLEENLKHREIRILHAKSSDYFYWCDWDRRVLLMNCGGSHHFAAARYIARKRSEAVPLTGRLYRFYFNEEVVEQLTDRFAIVVIDDRKSAASNQLFEALRRYEASYYWKELPRPYSSNTRALFLPKGDKRSCAVASLLLDRGMFNLGQHLIELTAKQQEPIAHSTSEPT